MTTHEMPEGRPAPSNLYARIVVALDGSTHAELVLPYVGTLAEQFGSSLILLRAATPAEAIAAPAAAATMPPLAPNVAAMPIDPTAVVATERRAVESYLRALAQRLRSRDPAVSYEDHEGAPTDCDHRASARARRQPDRHDHAWSSGLQRLVFGSTADAVLWHGPCPILLVRVGEAPGESQ